MSTIPRFHEARHATRVPRRSPTERPEHQKIIARHRPDYPSRTTGLLIERGEIRNPLGVRSRRKIWNPFYIRFPGKIRPAVSFYSPCQKIVNATRIDPNAAVRCSHRPPTQPPHSVSPHFTKPWIQMSGQWFPKSICPRREDSSGQRSIGETILRATRDRERRREHWLRAGLPSLFLPAPEALLINARRAQQPLYAIKGRGRRGAGGGGGGGGARW